MKTRYLRGPQSAAVGLILMFAAACGSSSGASWTYAPVASPSAVAGGSPGASPGGSPAGSPAASPGGSPGASPGASGTPMESITPAPTAGQSGSPGQTGPVTTSDPSSPPAANPSGGGNAGGGPVSVVAVNIAFQPTELTAPAGRPFELAFENRDAGVPHNVSIYDTPQRTQTLFQGEVFNGVQTVTYQVPALPGGTYTFICDVHPNMTGTLTAQ